MLLSCRDAGRLPNLLRQSTRTSIERVARLSTATQHSGGNDGALISSIRAGNQSAMAELYDRYSSIVYAVAMRVLGDTAAAERIILGALDQNGKISERVGPEVLRSQRHQFAATAQRVEADHDQRPVP